ncbi:hypothetical protein CR162_02960 [Pseudoroseomonas rhizosphaerae]|uniref:Uncharacterized protein n=1 Tax=Teichococcus rhizosphaerae TaxID=1335062 RepID=A0A2C7AHU3_9PROT|nr:hypothetical protein CR162_02960 [Pseudoroseomonas rhizosphaerae]
MPAAGYSFRVLREGREIGTHSVRREAGGVVRTVVALEVKLLSFTVFRYHHDYAERWEGGRLAGFASRLEKDGKAARLELLAGPEGLRGTGPEGTVTLPATAAPLSWWAPEHLDRPLFDAGTGLPLAEPPSRDWQGALTRWRWPARDMVALYDSAGRWVGFTMRGDDGSAVRYEPG